MSVISPLAVVKCRRNIILFFLLAAAFVFRLLDEGPATGMLSATFTSPIETITSSILLLLFIVTYFIPSIYLLGGAEINIIISIPSKTIFFVSSIAVFLAILISVMIFLYQDEQTRPF